MNMHGNHHPPSPPVESAKDAPSNRAFCSGTTYKPYMLDIAVSADKQLATANIDNPHSEVKVE